jgi:hypothetical protein
MKIPTNASTSRSSDQAQPFSTVSVKSPLVKSAVFSLPTSSIRPPTTPTAPANELRTTSTIAGMSAMTDTRPRIKPTIVPASTATQFQSMPRAMISPEPIAKPNAAIARVTAT